MTMILRAAATGMYEVAHNVAQAHHKIGRWCYVDIIAKRRRGEGAARHTIEINAIAENLAKVVWV